MGDYPGSGYKMSSYGLKTYNPQETVGQWTQCCKVVSHLRLLCIIEGTVVRQVNLDLGFPVYLRLQSLLMALVDPVCSRSIFCPAVGFGKDYMYNLTDYSRKDFVVAYENRKPQGVSLAESRFRTHLLFGREFIACYCLFTVYEIPCSR